MKLEISELENGIETTKVQIASCIEVVEQYQAQGKVLEEEEVAQAQVCSTRFEYDNRMKFPLDLDFFFLPFSKELHLKWLVIYYLLY